MENTCERDINANSSENVNVKEDQTRNGQEKHKNMKRLCLGLWCTTQKTKKYCRWGMYGVTFFLSTLQVGVVGFILHGIRLIMVNGFSCNKYLSLNLSTLHKI